MLVITFVNRLGGRLMSNLSEFNLKWWNETTDINLNSEFYDVKGFIEGKSSLKSVELNGLGELQGKSVLHLQCHFGMDSLSLARLGANVTGIDLSDKAIALAQKLNEELGLSAKFLSTDIYKTSELIQEQFDIVYTSYGVLCWLSDLNKWAEIIYSRLKPGGFFFIAETHPIMSIYGLDKSGELTVQYPYFNSGAVECISDRSYADRSVELTNTKTFQWDHTLSDVINALISVGLKIETVQEYPYCAYEKFPGLMFKDNDGWWKFKNDQYLPLLFSIKAHK
jgi:SAM-dependent methyltransferase